MMRHDTSVVRENNYLSSIIHISITIILVNDYKNDVTKLVSDITGEDQASIS